MIRHVGSRVRTGGFLMTISLLIAGCESSIPPPDRVAELEGRPFSYLTFEEYLQRNSIEGTGVLGSDVLSSLLDQFLDEQLLARLAIDRLGLPEEVDERSAVRALVETEIQTPDEASVARFYQHNLPQFDLPERVHLRQLLFAERSTAEQVRDSWSQGVSYASIIEGLAADPAAHVGEEGQFSRQELPSVFAEVLFSLADGEVSEVTPVDYGFHVFQVVRHLDAGLVPLESVSESIREELATSQREEVLAQLAAAARERYNVRVFERNLPFNYRGQYGSNGTHENS